MTPSPKRKGQGERGGGRSGSGRRGLWSHRKACTSRSGVRQVPVQVTGPGIRADVPPIWEAGVPQILMKDQGPLVIQGLGTTEDPSGSP